MASEEARWTENWIKHKGKANIAAYGNPSKGTDKKRLYRLQKGKCFYCEIEMDYKNSTVDHIIPLINHGSKRFHNKVCSCLMCNQQKGILSFVEFTNGEWLRNRRALVKQALV